MKEEIIKHSKKIYKEMNSNEHSFKEKAKEIVVEILIIVFAVSLSIWLHSWSEENHQHKETQTFLNGLKEDLQNDISNIQKTKKLLDKTQIELSFILNLTIKEVDSIKANNQQINSGSNFINTLINNGRYEGFKSSGKINTIENLKLRNKILSYYQQAIPQIALFEASYEKLSSRYVDLLLYGNEDINTTLLKKKTKIIVSSIDNNIEYNQKSYQNAIKEATEIVIEIDKEENK